MASAVEDLSEEAEDLQKAGIVKETLRIIEVGKGLVETIRQKCKVQQLTESNRSISFSNMRMNSGLGRILFIRCWVY